MKAGSKPHLLGGLWVGNTMAIVRSAVMPQETPQPPLAPSMPLADIGAWGSRRLLGGKGKLPLSSEVLNDVVLHSAVI